jgi:hypothetical protein
MMGGTVRKRVGSAEPGGTETGWLSLEDAEVVVTSEDANAPIEAALTPGAGPRWQAAEPGEQSIRIRFDQPHDVHDIQVVFDESEHPCVQEFALQWSSDGGQTFHPIVRQQFSFSPTGATRETEHYRVQLPRLTQLTLHIVPDISGGARVATLSRLRMGV